MRLIFEWTTEERISTLKIADRLNAMGIPTRYAMDGRKVRRPGKQSAEHSPQGASSKAASIQGVSGGDSPAS